MIRNQAEWARDIFLKVMEMSRPAMFLELFLHLKTITKTANKNDLKQ